MIEELKEWELQEQKRKALHSQVERNRRQKIETQTGILSELLPHKSAEKTEVLEAAVDYVTKLQSILSRVTDSSDHYPRVQKYLPPNPNKDIMAFLPSYRPPDHLNSKLGSSSYGRRNPAGLKINTNIHYNSSFINSAPLISTELSDTSLYERSTRSAGFRKNSNDEKSCSPYMELEQSKSNIVYPNRIKKRRLSLPALTRIDSAMTNVLLSSESCCSKDSDQILSTGDKICDASLASTGNSGTRKDDVRTGEKQRRLSILSLLNDVKWSNDLINEDIEKWTANESRRKKTHSLIEKKRRQKITDQYNQLKNLTVAGADADNIDTLQNAEAYILALQKVLKGFEDQYPQIKSHLQREKSGTVFESLMPFYKPFENVVISNISQKNNFMKISSLLN